MATIDKAPQNEEIQTQGYEHIHLCESKIAGPEDPGSESELLTFEIGGRLLLLNKARLIKYREYMMSVATVRVSEHPPADPDLEDGHATNPALEKTRKIEKEELLELLLPLPQVQIATEKKAMESTKDSTYWLDMALFQVEDRQFMVPKKHFLKSTIFDASGDSDTDDGRPIQLAGVLKTDFQALLKVVCPLSPSPKTKLDLSQAEWKSVFELATKWKMSDLRHMAIKNMSSSGIAPTERILFARQMGIPDWLESGYVGLVERVESLSKDDFQKLGMESSLKLSTLRRKYNNHHKDQGSTLEEEIKTAFRKEVEACATGVDRIVLGKTYGVSEWIVSGYAELASREKDVTLQEAEKLGLESVVKICEIRERMKTSPGGKNIRYIPQVHAMFSKDFADAQTMSTAYGPAVKVSAKTAPKSGGGWWGRR